jgi:hypothetical protein
LPSCPALLAFLSQFFRYNRIDLFAPAGVTYVNGTALQVPLFSLAPVSFNSPEAFLPGDASKMTFRNVQAMVEAINSGASPMPKSGNLVADGLTLVAEAELKALSLLANLWPSRNFTHVSSLGNASSGVLQQLSSASVFAVAVASAVAFEFPGQKLDGIAAATSEATQYSPAFASALSNLNALSLTWSAPSSAVVATVPLPFPSRQSSRLPVRRSVYLFIRARCRMLWHLCFVCGPFLCGLEFPFVSDPLGSENGVLAVVGVALPVAVVDAVMSAAFPPACDGISFLCWVLDERAYVLHARDFLCTGAARSCVGHSFSTVRPRVASTLVSSGVFKMRAVNGSSSVFYSMSRERSLISKSVVLAALNDDASPASQQQLEVNVFAVSGTTATVAVLSGAGMQASTHAAHLHLPAFTAVLTLSTARARSHKTRISR